MLEQGQEILEQRYKVLKKVGGGAFGEIYKCQKKKTNEIVAAKVEKAVQH